jgi:dienelactone hydrolase
VQVAGRARRAVRIAVVVAAAGLAYLGWEGSTGWRLGRLLVLLVVVVLLAGREGAPAGRGRLAVDWAAGAALSAVGVGIVLPHATKAGLTLTTAAGLLVLGGGVALLVVATTGLVRSVSGWRRVPVATALLAALAVLVLSLGQAVAATNVPRTEVAEDPPADLGPVQEVALEATDGVRLSAWYVPSRNRAAVVLLHGAGSTRSAVLDEARVLAADGYGLLLLDARGHGRSEGRAMDFGWYGDADVTGAVSYVASQPDVDPGRIAVLGLSMGGEEAIGAAAADPRIAAVVAEGATNRVAADKAWLPAAHGWLGTVQRGIDQLTYGFTDLLTAASPPIALRDAAAATAPRPVLLIAGGAVPDEPDASRYIAAAAPDSVQVWVAPGAGHTGARARHPQEWAARVTEFLATALEPRGTA